MNNFSFFQINARFDNLNVSLLRDINNLGVAPELPRLELT